MTELNAELPEFAAAEEGINTTLDTLGGKDGNVGRGFSDFGLTPKEASKEAAQKSSEEFAEKWEWGVRSLCQSANNFAQALGLSAGLYDRMDEQASTMFKTMYTHVAGNPHLSSDEIAQRDWSETLADNPVNNLLHPDYSEQARQDMMRTFDTNGQIVEEIAPQALANVNTLSSGGNVFNYAATMADPNGTYTEQPAWNSGAMERANEIRQANNGAEH